MSIEHLKIATRSSELAMKQSSDVKAMIERLVPDVKVSFVQVSTKGDRDRSDFLYSGSSVGYFTSEVENTLLNGSADIAVHSLKDLPTKITDGLIIAAIPSRQNAADAVVSHHTITSLNDLPTGATVGTSSLRRIAQVKHLRGDLQCLALRGNIETRIQKVESGQYDAIILAQAGLNRLGLDDRVSFTFDPCEFLPAPGQGSLAVEIRSDDTALFEILNKLDHFPSRITSTAERIVLSKLHGGCSIPLGVYSSISGETLTISAMLSDVDAENYITSSGQCSISDMERTSDAIANDLLTGGGSEILSKLRY